MGLTSHLSTSFGGVKQHSQEVVFDDRTNALCIGCTGLLRVLADEKVQITLTSQQWIS